MKICEIEPIITTTGRWTEEEHESFMAAIKLFGKCWKQIAKYVGTRNSIQVRSHAQKYYLNLGKVHKKKRRYAAVTGKEYDYKRIGNSDQSGVSRNEKDMKDTEMQTCEHTQWNKMDAETQCDNAVEPTWYCVNIWQTYTISN